MKYRKSGLLLSPSVFESLYTALIDKFEKKYDVSVSNLMDYQLFGYGNYDPVKPNLKQLILEETDSSINGKYLYNKYLEWSKGKSPIKFTREFTYIYFNTIGYKHLADFLKNAKLPEQKIKEQQLVEVFNKSKIVDEYYLGHNQNEEGEVTKSKLIISRNNHTVKWSLGYSENGMLTEYTYPGDIKYQENGMSFIFDNSKNELDRSLFVGFYFDRRLKRLPYLIGSYAGFDRDRKPVIGIVLFERKNDLSSLESDFKIEYIDDRITHFITNKRWPTSGTMPQNLNDLPKRIYSSIQNYSADRQNIPQSILYLNGEFRLYIPNHNNEYASFSLKVSSQGGVILENSLFKYTGYAFISEGAILSIHITYFNNVPHGAQILSFVGRYPKNKILWSKGSWHGLDENLKPSNKEVIIIYKDNAISKQEIELIEKSDLRLSTS